VADEVALSELRALLRRQRSSGIGRGPKARVSGSRPRSWVVMSAIVEWKDWSHLRSRAAAKRVGAGLKRFEVASGKLVTRRSLLGAS
jgi:hypothetical protein